jgi:hypothetical protein
MGNQVPADPVFVPAKANERNRAILIHHHGQLRKGSTEHLARGHGAAANEGGGGRSGDRQSQPFRANGHFRLEPVPRTPFSSVTHVAIRCNIKD